MGLLKEDVEELKQKLNSDQALLDKYLSEYTSLPKGSITKKERETGKIYYYITYREKDKIISDYLGEEKEIGNKIIELANQIERRRYLKTEITKLRADCKKNNRIIKIVSKGD